MASRAHPYHTFLVAAAPALAIFVHNVGQMATHEVWPSLGVGVLLAAAFLAGGRLLTGDMRRGGILASLALLLFFSHGHLQAELRHAHLGPPMLWANRYLIPAGVLLVVLAGIALARTRRRFDKFTTILNLTAALLVALQVGQIGLYKARAALSYRTLAPARETLAAPPAGEARTRPDIYYIIMDRYPNERCLAEFYGLDNGPFLDSLRSRGFYVASESHSNYIDSAHSLASSLNMEYLDRLGPPARLLPTDWIPLFELIADNRVARALTELGYRFIHFGSSWPPTVRNPHAFRNVNFIRMKEYDRILWSHTAAQPLLDTLGLTDVFEEKQVLVERHFAEIAKLAEDPEPTYAFAHFLLPHAPYVFDETGRHLAPVDRKRIGETERFVGQLRYANTRLMALVDTLLSRSPDPPIIILQGDEGPYPEGWEPSVSFIELPDAELRHKSSILNALLLPGASPERLYPGISPVNTFRLVLKEYFAAHIDFLPDQVYAFPNFQHLYELTDVTERVRETGDEQRTDSGSLEGTSGR